MVDSAKDGRRDLITGEATKQAPPVSGLMNLN